MKEELFEVLLQLLRETPDVINNFRRWWNEYYNYRRLYSNDKDVKTIKADKDIVFSQFDILEERIANIIKIAEKLKGVDSDED